MTNIFLLLAFGIIVGAVARVLVPGKERGGWIATMATGMAGAILGDFLGNVLGIPREGELAGFLMSLIGAIVLIAIYYGITRRRGFA